MYYCFGGVIVRYSIMYYFGDNIKSKWHKGYLDFRNFKMYLVRDDKTLFAIDNVIDGYLIDISNKDKCVKLYFHNLILNFFIADKLLFGLFSSPNIKDTEKVFRDIVRAHRIGVYGRRTVL